MKQTGALISRNLKIYFRDKSAVFFSLISMLVVIMLMVFFLGDMCVNSILSILEYYGIEETQELRTNAELAVLMWAIAGMVSVNAVTIAFSSMSMVDDKVTNKLQSFYVSPAGRLKIALGYLGASFITSVIICVITFAGAGAYAAASGARMLSISRYIRLFAAILVNSFTYSSMMYLIAVFVKSGKAWSSLGTITGTLVGFMGAIYLPVSAIPDFVQKFLKLLPVLHGATAFRRIISEDAMRRVVQNIPAEQADVFFEEFGITLSIGDNIISEGMQLGLMILYGMVFLGISVIIMRKRSLSDR